MLPPLPPMLLQRAGDRNNGLRVEDAWAIALAWEGPLQGHIVLEAGGDTVHKSYEWVRFEPRWIRYDNPRVVSAARVAALSWLALTCCAGYSGRENPVFWKCVFSELARDRVPYDTEQNIHDGPPIRHTEVQSVTDAHGFFDREGVEFPRFRLPFHRYQPLIRLFCGLCDEQLEPEHVRTLQQMMDQLAPWIDYTRTSRRTVVALDKINISKYTEQDEVALLQLLSELHHSRLTTSTWPAPTFLIDALSIEGRITAEKVAQVLELMPRLSQHDIEISTLRLHGRENMDSGVLAELVQSVSPLRTPASSHDTKIKSLDLSILGMTSLPAFMSALPHTASVRTVKVHLWARERDIEERSMAWLAYALFHPDTPSSTWKSLNLSSTRFTGDRVKILEEMARGNNLAAILLGGKYRSTSDYYRATLAPGTGVHHQPTRSRLASMFNQPFKEGQRWMTTSDTSTTVVEVCGVCTDDPTKWDEWVPVVIPAYGLGWIQSKNVTSVEKRRPAEAALTSLHLDHTTIESMDNRTLGAVFELIGQRLVHLELSCRNDIVSADDLRVLVSKCPSLESFAAPYKKAMWTETLLPRLRELKLRYDWTQDESLWLPRLPPSLEVLRIDADDVSREKPSPDYSVIHQLLSRPSRLRVLHWQEGLHKSMIPTPYTETCADTERRLDDLGVHPSWQYVGHARPPASCAAAFLSVPQAQRLDEEVAKIIVAFAGSRAVRSIVLEPQVNEILEARRPSRHYPI